LCSHSIVQDDSTRRVFPDIHPLDLNRAVEISLGRLDPNLVEPVWRQFLPLRSSLKHAGFCILQHQERLAGSVDAVQKAIQEMEFIPGKTLLITDKEQSTGNGQEHVLLLKSLRKLPGQFWLEWRMSESHGSTLLSHALLFAPKGLPGFLWWFLSAPGRRFMMNISFNNICKLLIK